MDEATLTVYIVDDDPAVRDSLSLLLSLRGYRTATFGSAEDFLAALRPGWCGCVMADIRMPGLSGLELQHELAHRGVGMPVVIITAHGDAASAREAFRANAVDFLEKPFDETGPLDAVEAAFERERERLDAGRESARREASLAALTERERDVMRLVARGLPNKLIADQLAISVRTVEVHRARVFDKMDVKSAVELANLLRDAQQG